MLCATALLTSGVAVFGEERIQRRFDRIPGTTTASVFSVAQDNEGFLWVGIEGGGLARFDGREFRLWAPDQLTTHILWGRGVGPELILIVEPDPGSQTGNTLMRIAGDGAAPIPGPGGQPWTDVRDAAYDRLQRLWVARPDALFLRDDSGEWSRIRLGQFDAERIRRLAPNRSGGVFVVTAGGILSLDQNGAASRIATTPSAGDVIDRGDGSIFYAEMKAAGCHIFELRDGRSAELLFVPARFNAFVLRGKTVWGTTDRNAVALRPGKEPEVLGSTEGITGGAFLVDREGSVWTGTAQGLVQIPEPETVIWGEKEGLLVASTRYLLRTEEGLWASTWGGLYRLVRVTGKWKLVLEEPEHRWPLVCDGAGGLWGKEQDEFIHRVGGRFIHYKAPNAGVLSASARSGDGSVWLATSSGLFKTGGGEVAPAPAAAPDAGQGVEQVLEDSNGVLWVTAGNRICHAEAALVAAGQPVTWSCEDVEGVQEFWKLLQIPGGEIWAAARNGVWRRQSNGWSLIPGSRDPASRLIQNIVPSTSGGVWVLGSGFAVRVLSRPDQPEGWEVLEQLSIWQGMPPTGIIDLIEDADATLWLATGAGIVRIGPDARRARPEPPRIKQTAFVVNGRNLDPLISPRLSYDSNQIEIHFAALSYRSEGLLRYQYRLRTDDPWIDSKAEEAVFRFFDLRPGRYSAEVRASLDGANWSPNPARIDFQVLGPWYLQWWVIAGALLLLVGVLFLAHHARVAGLVRLERQRALIAMDLHDEIGSGLGSIGILSGVAAAEGIQEDQRRDMITQIVDTTAEMGSALTDIVWSLRPDSATLEGLAYRLAQRASRLFPDGSPVFSTEFPSRWPEGDLSLAARHNLLLIGSEALHNAARHANANQVVLGLSQMGRGWRLWIADDGCGIRNSDPNCDGVGLGMISMRKRAEQIGAEISWSSPEGRGTTVTVVFSPEAKEKRAM